MSPDFKNSSASFLVKLALAATRPTNSAFVIVNPYVEIYILILHYFTAKFKGLAHFYIKIKPFYTIF